MELTLIMVKITIWFGFTLILLGVGAYFGTGRESVTALIPAFFGVPMHALGLLACKKPNLRKHVMHAAVTLGLLGFLGTIRGALKLPALLSGSDEIERPAAIGVQSAMCILSLIFVVLCIMSFIKARRSGAAD